MSRWSVSYRRVAWLARVSWLALTLTAPVLMAPGLVAALAWGQEKWGQETIEQIDSSAVPHSKLGDESTIQGGEAKRGDIKRDENKRDDVKRDDLKRDDAKRPAKDGFLDKKGRPRVPPGAPPPFTPENESAALKFVAEHHQELAALLKQLKTSSPEEYRRAIRELFRTSERLAQTKSSDADRYELDLEGWKIDSEIRLLAAKLTMGDDDGLRGKLRKQFANKAKLQVKRLELEKRRAEQRIKKIDDNIERLKKDQDQIAERQTVEMLRSVRKERPGKRPRATVGSNESSEKTTQRPDAQRVEKVEPAVAP